MIYNKKNIFQISSKKTPKKSSSFKKLKTTKNFENKQAFSLNSLNQKEFSRNILPESLFLNPSSIETSQKKDIFDIKHNISKESDVFEHKNIKKTSKNNENNIIFKKGIKSNKEEQNIYLNNYKSNKKEKNSIELIINDIFFDLLANIYRNEGIEIGFQNERKKFGNKANSDFNLNSNNNNNKMEEQITCICLKSKCLNNYCSCHKTRNICNKNCRCVDCENNNNI